MPVGEAVAAATAKRVLEKVAPAVIEGLAAQVGKGINQYRVQFNKTFQGHIAASLKRSRQIKTVVSKDKAVDLEKIYVPLLLSIEDRDDVQDNELNPTNAQGLRLAVSGTGGAGKTVLMKHLLNLSAENRLGIIPLFFELRNLDFSFSDKLQDVLFKDMMISGASETEGLFDAALENGLFAIFLDGFDEIKPDWQPLALQRIDTFSRKFDRCSIILSTRPKTGVHELTDFDVYHIKSLNKQQALQVVEKTPFEKVTKDKFYKALDSFLYDRHMTMMSIPILVAMMLLTFRSYSDIPARMTVFYAQAYNTLFAIHDSEGKLQFKRKYRSELAPDIFRSVLEAFCFLSLKNHDIEFTHTGFINYVSKAIKLTRVNCDPKDFADDLVQNVCILQPDGVSYVFVHRSFQEYFAASFAMSYSGEQPSRIIEQIADPHGSSAVTMMDEIDNAKLRRLWLLPKIDEVYKELNDVRDAPLYIRMGKFVSWIGVVLGRVRTVKFGGSTNKVYEDLEKLGPFCSGVTIAHVFATNPWANETALKELATLAVSENSAFSKEEERRDQINDVFGIEMNEDAENWLQTTDIKRDLDSQLSRLEAVRNSVRDFVKKQDNLEAELLEI